MLTIPGTVTLRQGEALDAPAFRVAVADDDPISRLLMKKRLARLGIHSVSVFCNGEDLLESLQHEPCNLVFLDISMPKVNGYGVAERLRKDSAFSLNREVFIAATTAEEPFNCIPRCRVHGIDWFISKPITERVLRSVCGQSGFFREQESRPIWDPIYFHCPLSQRARCT